MSCMKVRVNWHQEDVSSDHLVRVHKIIATQPPNCQFDEMKEKEDFDCLADAEKAMCDKDLTKYKRCDYCWDDSVIDLDC